MAKRRRAKLYFAIVCICTLFFLSASYMDKVTYAALTGTVKVESKLNVRTGPGTNYSKLKHNGNDVKLPNKK